MRAALVLVLVLLTAGCGYGVQGRQSRLPPDVQTIFVGTFANATFRPFLEHEITDAATDRFSRGRALSMVATPDRADALLSGTVTGYSSVPIAYGAGDRILEYRSTVTVDATVRRPGGKVLWRGTLSWSEAFPSSLDKGRQEDNERAAVRVSAERLADELYFRIVENF